LIAGGSDSEEAVKIWDLESGQELITLEGELVQFDSPVFSPDGNVLGCLPRDRLLHLWRAPSSEEIAAAEAKEKVLEKTP
jgi:WD40 repeat protein